jgi:UrcA family protein
MLLLHKSNFHVIALILMLLLIAGATMTAARADEEPSVTVRFHDLNLKSLEGVASLYERIHAAAVDVCHAAEVSQPVNRALAIESDTCISHAVANAVHTVHNEKLSAYHWERINSWKSHVVAAPLSAARH